MPYRIVGRVALPPQGPDVDPQPVADGAVFTGAGLGRLDVPGRNGNNTLLVSLAAGVDPDAAAVEVTDVEGIEVLADKPVLPEEIDRLRQVDWLPTALAAFMGVLAAVAVGHALLISVRRRRSDLAVLKALGFERRQVRTTVAWQATALSAAGLLVGIPLGLMAGRLVWGLVADGLGVSTSPSVPVLGVLAVAAGAIAMANLVAAAPGRTAARIRPAVVFRSE